MAQRVLHLIASNFVGGPEKQILHHAQDLGCPGFIVGVGSFHDSPQTPEILIEATRLGLPTVCLPGGLRARAPRELASVLRQFPGTLLCTHGYKANILGRLAARAARTPHIAMVRGWTAETGRVAFYEKLERRILRRTRWVACVSQRQAEQLRAGRSAGMPQPVVIRNAMLPPFSRAAANAPITRSALNIRQDAYVFGSVGRLSTEKGHRFLVEAFRRVCAERGSRPLHLIVLGEGREQPALETQARAAGVRVHFAGFQKECAHWMRLLDCMVLPSLTEGTPNAVLEALCLGIPVIATAVGGVPDLIAHESSGLLVPPGDPAALATAMTRLLHEPQLADQLTAGAAAVREKYSPQHQRQTWLALYETVLADHAVRFRIPATATGESLPAALHLP